MQKKLIIIGCIVVLLGIIGAVIYGNYWKSKYDSISRTIEAARGSKLEQQLRDITAELERTKSALTESQQSVGRLEDIDQRRVAGLERIYGIAESIGTGVSRAQSGNERAERALRGIAEIIDALEAEYSGSTNQR